MYFRAQIKRLCKLFVLFTYTYQDRPSALYDFAKALILADSSLLLVLVKGSAK